MRRRSVAMPVAAVPVAGGTGVTEIARVAGRGHSLVIDHGWPEVADLALTFAKRFAEPAAIS